MSNPNLRTTLNPNPRLSPRPGPRPGPSNNRAPEEQEQNQDQLQDQMQQMIEQQNGGVDEQQQRMGDEQLTEDQLMDAENAEEIRAEEQGQIDHPDEDIEEDTSIDSPGMEEEPPFLEPLDQEDEVPPFLEPVIDRPPKELPPENYAHWGVRQTVRTGMRVGEVIAGFYGDSRDSADAMVSTMGGIFKNAAKAFVAPKIEKLVGEDALKTGEKGAEMIGNGLKTFYDWGQPFLDPTKPVRDLAPTSKEVRNFLGDQLGEEWTEPKNDFEKFADNIAETTTQLLLTPSGRANVARKIGMAGMQAAGGETVKELLKHLDAGETTQELAKIGTMITLGLAGEINVRDLANSLWDSSRNSIPRGQTYNFGQVMPEMASLRREAQRSGGPTPGQGKVLSFINNLYNDLRRAGGYLDPNEMVEARKNLKLMLREANMDYKGEDMVRRVDSLLHGGLREYGTNINPTFWGNYTRANAATYGIEQTNRISRLINRNVDRNQFQTKVLTSLGGSAAGYSAAAVVGGGVPALTPAIVGTAGGAAFALGIKTLERFFRHPVLRNHYLNIIRNSTQKSSGAFVKSLKKLNDNYVKIYGDEDENMPDFLEPVY